MYQKKQQEQGVQGVVKINKIKFEPYGDLVDITFSQHNENLINNQNPQNQTENDEIPRAEYSNENDSLPLSCQAPLFLNQFQPPAPY